MCFGLLSEQKEQKMEDVARAVGANGASSGVKINGKTFTPRPLTLKELTELERDCVKQYRRQYLEALREDINLLPNGEEEFKRIFLESARWEADDLPKKYVYDVKKIPVTSQLEIWLKRNMDVDDKLLKKGPEVIRRLVATALDSEAMTEKVYKELTGTEPKKLSTGYANWWCTGTFAGMVSMLYLAVRDSGVTKEDIEKELAGQQAMLASLSREVEELSAPSLGNGQDSPEVPTAE